MSSKLFVGSLSFSTTDMSLRSAFEAAGFEVADAKVVTDRDTGRSRGFGFVTLGSDAEAAEAINSLNGARVDGREIRVDTANERQDRRSGGGGGGGGRGGGGGGGGRSGGGGGGGGGGGRSQRRW